MGSDIYLFCSFYSASGHSGGHTGTRVRCVSLAPVVPAQEGRAAPISTRQGWCRRTGFSVMPYAPCFSLLSSHSISKIHTYLMAQICK